MYNYTQLRKDAQAWLFELECAGREARRIVDGVIVAIYNTATETIYWLADMATGEEFVTTSPDEAVNALICAVS